MKINVPTFMPGVQDVERFANNGQVPNSAALAALANGFNSIAARNVRVLWRYWQPFTNMFDQATSPESYLVGAFWTGPACEKISILYGVTHSVNAAVNSPSIRTDIGTVASAAWGTTGTEVYFNRATAADARATPSQIYHAKVTQAVSRDTKYWFNTQVTDRARIAYMVILEEPSRTVDTDWLGIVNPGKFSATGPVYMQDIQDFVEASNELCKKQRPPLVCWNSKDVGSIDFTTTTWRNVISNGTEAAASTTQGYYVATENHRSRTRATFDVEYWTIARRVSGANNGEVRFESPALGVVSTITGITGASATYYSNTGTLAAQGVDKFDIQARVSATPTTVRVFAAGMMIHST